MQDRVCNRRHCLKKSKRRRMTTSTHTRLTPAVYIWYTLVFWAAAVLGHPGRIIWSALLIWLMGDVDDLYDESSIAPHRSTSLPFLSLTPVAPVLLAHQILPMCSSHTKWRKHGAVYLTARLYTLKYHAAGRYSCYTLYGLLLLVEQ